MSYTAANAARLLLVVACLASLPGCTTALTTAALQDALQETLWDTAGRAAEPEAAEEAEEASAPPSSASAADRVADDIAADRADADRRRAAIAEAMERLADIGTLDAATQATLVETLQATQQEDWPVVIEAFAATLAEATPAAAADEPSPPQPVAAEPPAPQTVAMETVVTAPAMPAPVAAEPPSAPASAPAVPEAAEAAASQASPAAPLAVRNACFASRVQAWGVVDRFAEDRFRPGQDVIVYFELDGLSAGESPAGFTTCIDAALRLVADDGRELHAWRFEPLAETSPSRRRDYFARYVLRLPETATAGGCRVEIAVTDTLAGATATATVPCRLE